MSFKENLKSELEYQGMLLKELSAKTGITVYTLNNYLYGHNSLPNIENAVKIARALNVTVEKLLDGDDEKYCQKKIKPCALPTKVAALIKNFESLDKIDQEAVQNLIMNLKKRY